MELALTSDLEELIDEQLTRGKLRTPAEIVRAALLLLNERSGSEEAESPVERLDVMSCPLAREELDSL